MTVQIVGNESCGYAIKKKNLFFTRYYDLIGGDSIRWRGGGDEYFPHCWTEDYATVLKVYQRLVL